MPRSPKDNQEIRDARREEILEAASRVFAEKGFARTKISDIAAAAGLSHGLVYHYFDGKDAIFGAIVDAMIARIQDDVDVPGATARDRLVASIERSRTKICDSHKIEANRLVTQAMLQGSVPPAIKARLFSHLESVFRTAVERVAEAQAEGSVDPSVPAEELASALVSLMRGMSIRMPGMPDLPFAPPRTQTIVRLLLPPPPERAQSSARASSEDRPPAKRPKKAARESARRGTVDANARRTRTK